MSETWLRQNLKALKQIQAGPGKISIEAFDFNHEGKWAGFLIYTKNSNSWWGLLNTTPKFDTMEDALFAMGKALKQILELDLSGLETP